MALISCPECEKDISDQADKCPNCGYPMKKAIIQDTNPTRPAREPIDKSKVRKVVISIAVVLVVILTVVTIKSISTAKTIEAQKGTAEKFLSLVDIYCIAATPDTIKSLSALSAGIEGFNEKSFEFSDDWITKEDSYEKDAYIFGSRGTIRIKTDSGKVSGVQFNYNAESMRDYYELVDTFRDTYGEPTSIELNGDEATDKEIYSIVTGGTASNDVHCFYYWNVKDSDAGYSVFLFYFGLLNYVNIYL